MDLEELAETISQKLWRLQLDQLKEVCEQGKIPRGNVITRRALIRLISESMDSVIDNEEEDVAKCYLQTMLKSVEQITQAIDSTEKTSTAQSSQTAAEGVSIAEKNVQHQLTSQTLQDEVKRLSERVTSASVTPESTSQTVTPVNRLPEVTIRRDFKICGQIGEKGQKDRLSYTNLMHQIERGLNKGHSEAEVVEAVIKAISPGLSIRDMLEIKRDLTLSQLKTILKGHFKEDSSVDIYYRLVNITQDSRESPQNFLFRAIELKERLLLSSREVGSDEQYSSEFIQRKFLRSVSTGLLSDHIKFQLKPYLDDLAVTDEILIGRMNEAASVESERQAKQKKSTNRTPKINELHTEMQTSQPSQNATEARVRVQEQTTEVVKPKNRKTPPVISSRESELYETVRSLREEIAEIRKSMSSPHSSHHVRRTARKGCKACHEQGLGDQCGHCFKCGQAGHFYRGCRGNRRLEGNTDGMKAAIQTVTPSRLFTSCQTEWDDEVHKLLCDRIKQLEAQLEQNQRTKETVGATYASHLSLRHHAKLKALIGKKCLVDCVFEGVATQALWDTGSQVTIINDSWRKSCLPHIKLRSTSELLGEVESLVGKAANQTPIPFAGWVELKFKLGSNQCPHTELLVPVLVSNEAGVAEPPIIGYNVIEHLVKNGMEHHLEITQTIVRNAFSIVNCKKADVLIHIVKSSDFNSQEGLVKVARLKTVIPAGQTREVKCSVRTGPLSSKQEVIFEPEEFPKGTEGLIIPETVVCLQKGNRSVVTIPVTNESHHDITLTPRTVLGQLQQIKAIYPVDVRPVTESGKTECGENVYRGGVPEKPQEEHR